MVLFEKPVFFLSPVCVKPGKFGVIVTPILTSEGLFGGAFMKADCIFWKKLTHGSYLAPKVTPVRFPSFLVFAITSSHVIRELYVTVTESVSDFGALI